MSSPGDPAAYDFDSLVRRFAARTQEAFRFLQEKGYRRDYGAQGYGSDPWQLVPGRHPSWPWFSVVRYSNPKVTFEFRFGDREINLEAACLFGPGKERIALWELPACLGGNPEGLSGAMWVCREPFLDETVDRLATALRASLPHFESLGESESEAIQAERAKRRQQGDREARRLDLERARFRSIEAFQTGRYREVVDLLQAFGPDLSDTDRKRIQLAGRRLGGTG